MTDLTPRTPYRPLNWVDAVLDIQDLLATATDPIYIVGGAVRDAMLSRPIKDLDLATPGDSIAIAKKIANAFPGGALYIMDEQRGVARAIVDTMYGKMNVDVAQFRGEDDGILSDLTDRDFTINAMMVELNGDMSKIIDPLMGERDVAGKIIRRCAEHAVASDPVRALRALRQSIQLGFRIEPETLRDIRAAKDLLGNVSAERVRDELFKILQLRRPTAALRVMHRIGLLDAIVPISAGSASPEHIFTSMDKLAGLLAGFFPGETDNLASDFGFGMAVMQLNRVRKELEDYLAQTWADDRPHRALLMFAVLLQSLPADSSGVGHYADALRLSSAERKRLLAVIGAWESVYNLPDYTPLALHRYWYPLGEAGIDVCLLTLSDFLARQGVHLDQNAWLLVVEKVQHLLEAYYLQYERIVRPPALVTGDDLIDELALKPGKVIGQLLDTIREAQVSGEIETTEDALRYARAALGDDARGAGHHS